MEIILLIYLLTVILTLMIWCRLLVIDYKNSRHYTIGELLQVFLICLIPVFNVVFAVWGVRELGKLE
jgi:hypothetical protein